MNKISPSVMCIDTMDLKNQLAQLDAAGVDLYHIDIMDGHFVPNFCLNGYLMKDIARVSKTPMDVHLMVTNPTEFIEYFAGAGAEIITLHVETLRHPIRALRQIRALGKKAGLAVNPATDISNLKYMLDFLDLVCIMTVDPGFAGQALIPSTLRKITELREMFDTAGKEIDIMVDGQVKEETAQMLVDAGANVLVLGSSGLFKFAPDQYPEVISMYKNIGKTRGTADELKLLGIPAALDPANDILVPTEEGVAYEAYSRKYSKGMFGLLADPGYIVEDEPYYDFYKAFVRDGDRKKFSDAGLRFDSTVVMKGCAGPEFKKTAGHFHCEAPGKGMSYPELYQVVKGRALFVMQKVDDCHKSGKMVVEDAILAEVNAGEAIVVPPEYGHCTINIGEGAMVFINLVSCASENYYDSVKASAGMCCYAMKAPDGGYRIEENRNYEFHCKPRVVTAVDSPILGIQKDLPVYRAFLENPAKFAYLNAPENNLKDYFAVFRDK